MTEVWYKLGELKVLFVEVREGAQVAHLTKAIKAANPHRLSHVDEANLNVFAAGVDPTEDGVVPLESTEVIPATTDQTHLIVVVVPLSFEQQQKEAEFERQQKEAEEDNRYKTPGAASRQGHKKKDSPGERLGLAAPDAIDSSFLSAAKTFCDVVIPVMNVPEVASLRQPSPKLNDFQKIDLPHTCGRIDMRFGFKPEWPSTPVGEKLCGLMKQEYAPNVILVGKSGCGKTSSIFAAAQESFCILITASWAKADDNLPASRGDPGGFDESFSDLVTDVADFVNRPNVGDDDKRAQAEHRVLAFVVARMLLLWTFQRRHTTNNNGPLSWLMYQLTGDMHHLTSALYDSLLRRENNVLRKLKRVLSHTANLNFFFAFDEAQHGYKLLKKKKLWKSKTNPKEFRGIACPLLRELTGCRPVVIAGTAMDLGSIQSCRSDVGKSENTTVINDFPSVSLEEITDKLDAILNMEGTNYIQNPRLFCKLEGRGRLLGGFFTHLAEYIQTSSSTSKQKIFQNAIETHYSKCLEQLAARIRQTFKLDEEETDILLVERRGEKRRLPEGLDIVATASMIGNPVSISHKKVKVDLLHVGLCSVRMVPGNEDEFVLDENLGRDAVLQVAQGEEFITTTFAKATELCKSSGGHAMEPLIVAELHDWSNRNPQKTVRDFLSAACGGHKFLPGELPNWIDEAHFSVEGGTTKKGFQSQVIPDDVRFVEEAVQNKKNLRNMLLSPSTVKRPDFEAVMGKDGKASPWFLSVSSKLYSKPLDDTSNDDFRSTKPSKFYTHKNGTKNMKCCKLRTRWEETLKNQQGLFHRCLRIHVCLPEVKRPGDDKKRIFLDGEDNSIVLYITSQNIRNIFRSGCLEVLTQLGCLQE